MKPYSLCGVERTGLLRESALIIHIKPVERLKAKSFMQTFLKRIFSFFFMTLNGLSVKGLMYCCLCLDIIAYYVAGLNAGIHRLLVGVRDILDEGIGKGWAV